MFISNSDVAVYLPDVDTSIVYAIIADAESMFCSLLPLEQKARTLKLAPDEIYIDSYSKDRSLVKTKLLNIQSLTIWWESTAIITDWLHDSEFYFVKDDIEFDPLFVCVVTSGYTSETIPWDLKQALKQYVIDSCLNIGVWSNVTSLKLWPRSVSYWDPRNAKTIHNTLLRYMIY